MVVSRILVRQGEDKHSGIDYGCIWGLFTKASSCLFYYDKSTLYFWFSIRLSLFKVLIAWLPCAIPNNTLFIPGSGRIPSQRFSSVVYSWNHRREAWGHGFKLLIKWMITFTNTWRICHKYPNKPLDKCKGIYICTIETPRLIPYG